MCLVVAQSESCLATVCCRRDRTGGHMTGSEIMRIDIVHTVGVQNSQANEDVMSILDSKRTNKPVLL